MNIEEKIKALSTLGKTLLNSDNEIKKQQYLIQQKNPWFTPRSVNKACQSIGNMLQEEHLRQWLQDTRPSKQAKKVGLVLAGNIPMVGFHDILSVLVSGHHALIKLSSQDDILIPLILKQLSEIDTRWTEQYSFVERLKDFDAVIATGNNNTSRYFEYYFSQYPHIIRKNRNSVAILTGNENQDDIKHLGADIFDYFGLGCRSVSKLYVPKKFDFKLFIDKLSGFDEVQEHNKYMNNYEYNKSIFLVNSISHFDNGFLIVREAEALPSPISVVHFEFYEDLEKLSQQLQNVKESIQCIVSKEPISALNSIPLGQSQSPQLWDYADGVNTLKFLASI